MAYHCRFKKCVRQRHFTRKHIPLRRCLAPNTFPSPFLARRPGGRAAGPEGPQLCARFKVGQNIASTWTTRTNPEPAADFPRQVTAWFNEVHDFGFYTTGFSHKTGHYSQVCCLTDAPAVGELLSPRVVSPLLLLHTRELHFNQV
ncbi:hypothetical protein PR048_032124 [Dryococelus australis]|uniref:Uncharacterized protein n=1 Tax=Dryococelus australis TaxID=614101 RepID=A0ABQ9G5G8_9NEOP|nr:hypothetical protein PR048_032124 [Dryococelus australis]